jgi:transglutaminase-like putative cysteine protease
LSQSSVKVASSELAPKTQEGSLPLQLAALLGQSLALYALASPIISIGYTMFLVLLGVVGLFTARAVQRREGGSALLLPGAIGMIATFFVVQFLVLRFRNVLPLDFALTSADTSLIMALTFTATLAIFFWLTDSATLFSCVWSMAMSGLAATINLNVVTVVCFGAYLLCALFLLVHHHTLAQAGAIGRRQVTSGSLLLLQVRTAALLWLLTFVLGCVVAIPLQMIGRNMSLERVLERLKVSPEQKRLQGAKQLRNFESAREFAVGLGPVTDDDTLLYRVKVSRPYYWRISTFATLQGNLWVPYAADLSGEALAPQSRASSQSLFTFTPGVEGSRAKTEPVQVMVEPLVSLRGLCHIAEPRELRTDLPTIIRRVDGTLGMIRNQLDMAPPLTAYSLTCDVSIATAQELNNSSRRYPKEIQDRYLQDPNPTLLDELARTAIGTTKGPFDQAEAIRQFVANRCIYSLDAPVCPLGRNPAEWFLNESKVGYCDLYATSVTMLCRAAGIPARIATGFNAGEVDPDHPSSYHLRERNRHAWCEVFFTGYGWIPFDATALTAEATSIPVASPPSTKAKTANISPGPIALAGIAVLGLLAVGGNELYQRRRGVRPGQSQISPEEIFARRVLATYRSALHQLKRHGAMRESTMTVGEHTQLVQKQLGSSVGKHYERLAKLSERALFARQALQEKDVSLAQEALRELNTNLKERKH